MTPAPCIPDPAADGLFTQEGRVVAVSPGLAWVETRRQSACGGCGHAGSCAVPVLGGVLKGGDASRLQVPDHLGLVVGEHVVLGLPEGLLSHAAALAYLVPPLVLVLAAALAQALGAGEGGTALAGIAGLALGLGLTRLLSGGAAARGRWRPALVGRAGLDREKGPQMNANERESMDTADAPAGATCVGHARRSCPFPP